MFLTTPPTYGINALAKTGVEHQLRVMKSFHTGMYYIGCYDSNRNLNISRESVENYPRQYLAEEALEKKTFTQYKYDIDRGLLGVDTYAF